MTLPRLRHRVRLALARGTERFGRTGWLGLALCVTAAAWLAQAWNAHQAELGAAPIEAVSSNLSAAPVAASSGASMDARALARQDEQALLLTQIQQVATSQGLAWSAADYKLVPAGESTPLALEVRCTLKGSYPRLRATFAQWLQQVPGLAIRDLAMSRPSSEVADVEAKLQVVIFMRTDAPEDRP